MAGVHNLFRLYALVICDHCAPPSKGNVEDFHFVTFILCLQFPIVLNHHTVGTASWQIHGSLLLYCTAMVAYVYQTPTFLPHYGANVKVKSQHICQAIPARPAQGLGWSSGYKWLVHNIQPMLHFTWKFSHLQKI